jgi:phosphoglycerate dehydrogenase-like enzyme
VGFGNIGRAVAGLLQGFQTRLIYCDPNGQIGDTDVDTGARCVAMPELLAHADIVTLHCPGGARNRHLLDAAAIAAMKPGAIIINAARGELIAEDALADALASGHLLGAGLDTFEQEPLSPHSRLRQLDAVVLTPHSAGSVLDHVEPMAAHAFENIQRMLRGELPRAADLVVNPAHPRFAAKAPQP